MDSQHEQQPSKDEGMVEDDEDSEDHGLSFDDIISPGGQHLNFGTFQNMEIKKLWAVAMPDNMSVVINKYGTNLFKSKSDSLAAIEAKYALNFGTTSLRLPTCKGGGIMTTEVALASDLNVQTEVASPSFPSPELGSQQAPHGEMSSQEDLIEPGTTQMHNQEAGKETSKQTSKEILDNNQVELTERSQIEEHTQEEVAPGGITGNEDASEQEQVVPHQVPSDQQGARRQNDHLQQQEKIRQSERIKKQNNGQIKVANKAEALAKKKNLEGNSHFSQNSFAVLNNNELMIRAHQMGVNSDNLTSEQFDILKDLELARAGLISRSNSSSNEINSDLMPQPNVKDVKCIEWLSDESDGGEFIVVSAKKSRKKRGRRKTNILGKQTPVDTHPFDGGVQKEHCEVGMDKDQEPNTHPSDGGNQSIKDTHPLDGGIQKNDGAPKIFSGYNLRKVVKTKHMEL